MNGTCEGRRRDDKVYISPFRYYCIYATNAAAAGSHRITSDSTTSTVQAKVKGRLKKKIATAAAAAGGSHKARTLKKMPLSWVEKIVDATIQKKIVGITTKLVVLDWSQKPHGKNINSEAGKKTT